MNSVENIKNTEKCSSKEKEKINNGSPTKTPKRPLDETENTEPISSTRKRIKHQDCNARYAPTFVSPVSWTADAGVSITALLVEEKQLVVATKDGLIYWLDHDGSVLHHTIVECPVSRILRDGDHLYAWGHSPAAYTQWKGALFEITSYQPRLIFALENFGEWVTHVEILDGSVVVADDKGNMAMLGCYGDIIWKKDCDKGGSKMFLLDRSGIYLGHKKQVTKYGYSSGQEIWNHDVTGRFVNVKQAVQTDDYIFVDAAGQIEQLDKQTGSVVSVFAPLRHRSAGVCVRDNLLITGSCPTVLFNIETKEEMYHMNYAGRLGDAIMGMSKDNKLFIAWDKVYCINLEESSIKRAISGRSTNTKEISLKEFKTKSENESAGDILVTALESPIRGVVLRCTEENITKTIKEDEVSETDDQSPTTCEEELKRLIVKPLDTDYHTNWYVRFPQNLMTDKKRYVVDGLKANQEYKFYSVVGDIREYCEEKKNVQKNSAAAEHSAESST